jgi:uncharacterized protein (TIGR03083 family)
MRLDIGRQAIVDGLLAEYETYRVLLRSLDAADDTRPTRCAGWTVHDVVAHVVGLASDAFAGRIGRFTPDQQAAMRRDLTPADLVDELDQALLVGEPFLRALTDEHWSSDSGAPGLTLGEGLFTLWFDAWVHRDDVRAALGQGPDHDPGLAACRSYLRWTLDKQSWTPPTGVDVDAIDDHSFVLAGTGRIPASTVGLDPRVNLYRA